MSDTPLTVTIIPAFPPDHSRVEPHQLLVPWRYAGTIVFTIADSAPEATFDQAVGGVTFVERPAPFTLVEQGARKYVFGAINDKDSPADLGTFPYTIGLSEGFSSILVIDPTVENESPPPLD